jgi:hypothetical protein
MLHAYQDARNARIVPALVTVAEYGKYFFLITLFLSLLVHGSARNTYLICWLTLGFVYLLILLWNIFRRQPHGKRLQLFGIGVALIVGTIIMAAIILVGLYYLVVDLH